MNTIYTCKKSIDVWQIFERAIEFPRNTDKQRPFDDALTKSMDVGHVPYSGCCARKYYNTSIVM